MTRAKNNHVAFFYWAGGGKKYQNKDKVPLVDMFDFRNLFEKAELKRNETVDVSMLSKPDLLKIRRTMQAIERHVNLAGIAQGLLRHLALKQAAKFWSGYHGWLRTYSSEVPSEGVVQNAIRAEFFVSMQRKVPVSRILQLILHRGRDTALDMDF